MHETFEPKTRPWALHGEALRETLVERVAARHLEVEAMR